MSVLWEKAMKICKQIYISIIDTGRLNEVSHFSNENSLCLVQASEKGEWCSLICESVSVLAKNVPKIIYIGSLTAKCST